MFEKHKTDKNYFNLKQDRGGIIDIEFIVQYFVLAFSNAHKELTHNIGNIGLLNLFSEKGLMEASIAKQLINAYRTYRTLQHQLGLEAKLDGNINYLRVGSYPNEVREIWGQTFN
jgi:glutamate-ammonia-ligase adenylyltransferase